MSRKLIPLLSAVALLFGAVTAEAQTTTGNIQINVPQVLVLHVTDDAVVTFTAGDIENAWAAVSLVEDVNSVTVTSAQQTRVAHRGNVGHILQVQADDPDIDGLELSRVTLEDDNDFAGTGGQDERALANTPVQIRTADRGSYMGLDRRADIIWRFKHHLEDDTEWYNVDLTFTLVADD